MTKPPPEHEVLLSILDGDPTFKHLDGEQYRTRVQTSTAKVARDKENKFARMTGEGITPIFRFRREQAPITRLVANGNTLELDVILDTLTRLPRRK